MSIHSDMAGDYSDRRDYYAEFIEDSRWLGGKNAQARTLWFDNLSVADKEHTLFEFEMMLKGIVCFGNPVNYSGPKRRQPAISRNFAAEVVAARDICTNIVELGRRLTIGGEGARIFQRYLESVLARDHSRFQIIKQSLEQDTPKHGLDLLVSAFQNLSDILDGMSNLSQVSFRTYSSVIQTAQREIHRSVFFDPLAVLEFRAEFDQIRSPDILACIRQIESDPARRVAALTFLTLFRMLRYLDAIDRARLKKSDIGIFMAWLAVLRSDARALGVFLKRDTAVWIANGFSVGFETLDPPRMNATFDELEIEFYTLKSLRELLASMADQLRLEQRKVYEQQIPALETINSQTEFMANVEIGTQTMRSFLRNAVVLVAREFNPSIEGARMFAGFVSPKDQSERLRRDVWMFQQILRAFIEKANASMHATDRWDGGNSLGFVRAFVSYFRSMGYQLLRYSDYQQFDNFIGLVDRLREGDVLEVQRLSHVIETCTTFQNSLSKTFQAVSRREELADTPFDKKEAAQTLKLFLGQ